MRSSRPMSNDSGDTRGDVVGASTAAETALQTRYLPAGDTILCPAGELPLALIQFGAATTPASPCPAVNIHMRQLGAAPRTEIWTTTLPVQTGEADGIRYSTDGQVMFGLADVPLAVSGPDFEAGVQRLYQSIFTLIESQHYPHLLRVWNYFPDINREYDDLENYRRFCRGRALAFQENFSDYIFRLPSASAVGVQGGSLVVYFIAAREPGLHRENPRQRSAYSYPVQYGPRSPSFARATLKRFGARELFFISGTASIVGYESLHRGDVRAQFEETMRNIEALIESTVRDESVRFSGLKDISQMKVYLRRADDLEAIRDLVESRIGSGADMLYLHGDICRRELLVEVEAVIDR